MNTNFKITAFLIVFFLSPFMLFAQNKPNMVLVKGGSFKMGNSKTGKDNKDESPVHTVKLSSYYIGTYEVSVKEYRLFIKDKTVNEFRAHIHTMPSAPDTTWWQGHPDTEKYYTIGKEWWGWQDKNPMQHVNWYDAVAYCNWLSQKHDFEKCYYYSEDVGGILCDYSKNGYRLPTEAEWEYAAKGGSKSQGYKYSGSNSISEVGWYDENTLLKSPKNIGTKKPNELGIYDMTGNVWEWCNDFYSPSYYKNSPTDNPVFKISTGFRIIRGGSWHYREEYATVTSRDGPKSSYTNYNYGFRLVRKK